MKIIAGRAVLVAVALVGSLVACSSSPVRSEQGPPSGVASSSQSSHSAAPTTEPAAQHLESLLITRVPAGFSVEPDSVGDTGPSDLAKATRDDGHADAARVLTADGFDSGYQRLWTNTSGAQLIDFLYQFKSAKGAQAYFTRSLTLAPQEAAGKTTLHRFAVRDLPHATGFFGNFQGRSAAIVLVRTGSYVVQVSANASSSSDLELRAGQAAKDQSARL